MLYKPMQLPNLQNKLTTPCMAPGKTAMANKARYAQEVQKKLATIVDTG